MGNGKIFSPISAYKIILIQCINRNHHSSLRTVERDFIPDNHHGSGWKLWIRRKRGLVQWESPTR